MRFNMCWRNSVCDKQIWRSNGLRAANAFAKGIMTLINGEDGLKNAKLVLLYWDCFCPDQKTQKRLEKVTASSDQIVFIFLRGMRNNTRLEIRWYKDYKQKALCSMSVRFNFETGKAFA